MSVWLEGMIFQIHQLENLDLSESRLKVSWIGKNSGFEYILIHANTSLSVFLK